MKHLQSDLDEVRPPYKVKITGVFDAPTAAAVRSFQARYGMPATGIVDFLTAGSLDQFAAGGRSLPKPTKPTPPSAPPVQMPPPSSGDTSDMVLRKAEAAAICGWVASVMKAPSIVAPPLAGASVDLLASEYRSGCAGGVAGMKKETAENLIDAGIGYVVDKGLGTEFETRIESILAQIGVESKSTVDISKYAWNSFILSLIQRLKNQEVKCEQGSKFPPPITCSTQRLTNQLLSLLRR